MIETDVMSHEEWTIEMTSDGRIRLSIDQNAYLFDPLDCAYFTRRITIQLKELVKEEIS